MVADLCLDVSHNCPVAVIEDITRLYPSAILARATTTYFHP